MGSACSAAFNVLSLLNELVLLNVIYCFQLILLNVLNCVLNALNRF